MNTPFRSFSDDYGGRLTKKQWLILIGFFIMWHFFVLQISQIIGNFDPNPNTDSLGHMRGILQRGYPSPSEGWAPPLYGYVMAFKWKVTRALGLPYWAGKYLIDLWPVVLSGILSVMLGTCLTGNRLVSIASGLGLICAPIYILGVAEELSVIYSQPFVLSSFILFIIEVQRSKGIQLSRFVASGSLMGIATLIRGETQFIIFILAPYALWVMRLSKISLLRKLIVLIAFLMFQLAIVTPWVVIQKSQKESGAGLVFSGAFYAYYEGVTSHAGNRISDWLSAHYDEPGRSIKGILAFNLMWLKKDPTALIELYVMKYIRAWYMSDSGRWDKPLLLLHFPLWAFALLGIFFWIRKNKSDPAYVFALLIIFYYWNISVAVSGIARYTAPLYGLIGMLGGIVFLTMLKFYVQRPYFNDATL